MDPAAYKAFNGVREIIPEQPPLPDTSAVDNKEASAPTRKNPQSVDPGDWTIYNSGLSTNRDTNLDHDHGMIGGGWAIASGLLPPQKDPEPGWMSTTEQQPIMWGANPEMDEEATPRPSDTETLPYPHPNLSLPHPSLSLDFRMSVTLNPRISVGPTPFGQRNWISFTGGSWSGSWGCGIVLPGGQDSQLIIPSGAARLETNYLLQTIDTPPAYIAIKTHGWRTGPPEILEQLADPKRADDVDPNLYKFRLFVEMETGDERYSDKVNCVMWVGAGMRKGKEVIYDAYRVS